ncbi:retrovirus-related pol polyprotein from transposon TNT 1-94, partial [Tanacetum coccineum]
MTTLAEHIIVAGVENRPLMLEKSVYDSWASRIRLFIKGKKHGRMMLDLIDNDDCDIQATNIILHGLLPDVYALVNHQEAAKDIWDRVKLLMKGTELSYQERECRLYNLFDKFAYVQGETLYEYYRRFSQLINDMHTIGMTMQQVRVNTKFLNALLPEWSKFVTDVNLAVPMFQQGEYLIECINKAMEFLSAVASSFPPSNNQLRTSSNPRNQATIQDAGQLRVVKCYNYQREGHMARQCTQPKRPRNAAWFKEKLMLAESQEAGLMANRSRCDTEVLSEVPYSDSYPDDMINQ